MQYFVLKSIKGRRCIVLNQYDKSSISDIIYDIISKVLNVHSHICEIIDEYFLFVNNHKKIIEREYD